MRDDYLVTHDTPTWRSFLCCVIPGRGDLATMPGEHVADRLDPEPGPMFVDESD
jgi:hypothetical protein